MSRIKIMLSSGALATIEFMAEVPNKQLAARYTLDDLWSAEPRVNELLRPQVAMFQDSLDRALRQALEESGVAERVCAEQGVELEELRA